MRVRDRFRHTSEEVSPRGEESPGGFVAWRGEEPSAGAEWKSGWGSVRLPFWRHSGNLPTRPLRPSLPRTRRMWLGLSR